MLNYSLKYFIIINSYFYNIDQCFSIYILFPFYLSSNSAKYFPNKECIIFGYFYYIIILLLKKKKRNSKLNSKNKKMLKFEG